MHTAARGSTQTGANFLYSLGQSSAHSLGGTTLALSGAVMNKTPVTEFFILGFSETPGLRMLLFFGFLLLYTVALSGNLLIVVVISSNPALYTPMYFFLVNLAVVDILCTSTILPELLVGMVASKTISYGGCMAQLFCFTGSMGAELPLFLAMAYDL